MIKHIALAGNIGAGKTTLATHLGKHFDWKIQYEDIADNPYLNDFYDDMKRWSFNLQIYFLNSRYQHILDIQNGDTIVVQDRTIYEDAYIFAPNLHDMGLMTPRDFNNYQALFKTMNSQINPPDLLIYLRGSISKLVQHIGMRGREYEETMSIEYLKRLNERYESWIETYNKGKLLIIDVDNINLNNQEDLGKVINQVQSAVHGLFTE